MPTFDESWSGRLRIIGDLERPDHWHLTPQDTCYFFGEYTARAGYGHSSTNQLIHNLKKKPELAGTQQYVWKGRAIETAARTIRANLKAESLNQLTVVPSPPSKRPASEGYDDRVAQIARAISPQINVREALVTAVEREAMHVNQNHRDPGALRATLATVAAEMVNPPPIAILLDDVLTTGCSFTVCRDILSAVWPQTSIIGIFIARRVIDRAADFAALGDLDI
jgi:predicted amidophosphoribosyltransferase